MIGLTAPDKIIFDEVHYVPAATQMLEPGIAAGIGASMETYYRLMIFKSWI